MSETIKDGKGRGYLVEVNENHHIKTDAVTQREESHIADIFGQTYVISTKAVTLNSTNRHVLLYIKNTSPTRKLYHATLEIGYNGGSVNHNRSMNLQILGGFIGPTVNHKLASISKCEFYIGQYCGGCQLHLGWSW